MPRLDVRRLAAVDIYGSVGSRIRRRIILIEFVLGILGLVAIGVWNLADHPGTGGRIVALWLIGVGINYLPLALHAM
jgi:hypothetical protein